MPGSVARSLGERAEAGDSSCQRYTTARGGIYMVSRSLVYRQQHVARNLKKLENNADAAGGNPQGPVEEVGDAQGLQLEEQAQHEFLSHVT